MKINSILYEIRFGNRVQYVTILYIPVLYYIAIDEIHRKQPAIAPARHAETQ